MCPNADLARLELLHPCGAGMNLLSCPDFGTSQPYGPARKPRRIYTHERECPTCDYRSYDMRKRRMMITKRYGYCVGLGPAARDVGLDVYPHGAVACCAVM